MLPHMNQLDLSRIKTEPTRLFLVKLEDRHHKASVVVDGFSKIILGW